MEKRELDDTKYEFEFRVSSLGLLNSLRHGTLIVSSLGLKYVDRSKTEEAWQHIRHIYVVTRIE